MTLVDTIIPYYYWFKNGFGEISVPMALVNLALLVVTMITVKGIYIPLWIVPIIAVVVICACVGVGWFFEKYDINSRIATHVTKKQNPMLNEMFEILKKMEKE